MNKEIIKNIQNIITENIWLIKFKFGELIIDLSINNFIGLCKILFISNLEQKFFKMNIFRTSFLILKTWSLYEGCIIGANNGLFTSYALEVMIIYIFNNYYFDVKNEIDILVKFFEIFADFEWDIYVLTMYGRVSKESYYELYKNVKKKF